MASFKSIAKITFQCYLCTRGLFLRRFAKGSFTSWNKKIRKEAIEIAKSTVKIAKELGSSAHYGRKK